MTSVLTRDTLLRAEIRRSAIGYDIHITRKEDWADSHGLEMSLDEWLGYVASEATMRHDGFAETDTPDGAVLRIESPGEEYNAGGQPIRTDGAALDALRIPKINAAS